MLQGCVIWSAGRHEELYEKRDCFVEKSGVCEKQHTETYHQVKY